MIQRRWRSVRTAPVRTIVYAGRITSFLFIFLLCTHHSAKPIEIIKKVVLFSEDIREGLQGLSSKQEDFVDFLTRTNIFQKQVFFLKCVRLISVPMNQSDRQLPQNKTNTG